MPVSEGSTMRQYPPVIRMMFTKTLLRDADPAMLRVGDGLIDVLVGADDLIAGRYRVFAIGTNTVSAVLTNEEIDV